MGAKTTPSVVYDVQLMAEDMAARGWQKVDLARRTRPRVSAMSVIRFLRGDFQTARMAGRLARALGHPVERYVVRSTVAAVSPVDDEQQLALPMRRATDRVA